MHALICGATMTGKTTLARYFARDLAAKGQSIICYDPVGSKTGGVEGWPPKSIVFTDPLDFADYMSGTYDEMTPAPSNAHVFVDEADEIFSLKHPENFWMLKKGRHFGLSINVITQRPHLVAPTARNQCGKAFVFRLARQDMRNIGADFGHNLNHAPELDRGEFFILESGRNQFTRSKLPGFSS